jgi:hypothetical protein
MKFFPVRYWWTERGTAQAERTACTVTSGNTPAEALQNFKRENPHLTRAAIIDLKPKKATP